METSINHFAVIGSALVNLFLGAIWYSPLLFYKVWKRENNLTDEQIKTLNPLKVYGLTFLLSLCISYNMAFFLADGETDISWGVTAGFLTGFGFSSLIFCIIALFEMKSIRYMLINGGYITLYFTIIGAILGGWK
jgi:hypothetical protein